MEKDTIYSWTSRHGIEYQITLELSHYTMNDSYAVEMYCFDPDLGCWGIPYANLTVNIENFDDPNMVCIDTNNLGDKIVQWAIDNGIIENNIIGYTQSGFCQYPIVRLTDEFLQAYS